MIIGKYYKVSQVTSIAEKNVRQKTWGKCIWVHPKLRFCVLEFDGGIRECFSPFELGAT